ncbi:hypothetical protein [Spirosoma telluris]
MTLDPKNALIGYFMPCPNAPRLRRRPTGEFIVGSGKLAAVIPVFSFDKI